MTADKNLIEALYKRYRHRPATLDDRGLALLADYIVEERGLELNDDRIVFTEMGFESPFREILLNNIHGVADLGGMLAIVMHSSIIFFNKESHAATVHLKPAGFTDRLVNRFRLHK